MPELLAPAGDWECLRAAVANGADAVYFGLPRFNARLRAENFREEDLPEVMAFLHDHGVKGYIAFNTLVFTSELPLAAQQLQWIARAGADAAIVQDLGLAWLAREIVPEFAIHASTQMTITSPEGVEFAHRLGIRRVVLARELSLRELAKFRAEEGMLPLEVFVHGALCVAYSGQCLTSESLGQRSANRGECAQACRMPYEMIVDGVLRDMGDRRYLLSPQDLAAVDEIPSLIELGVESFKIEGRLKSPEYVAAVTQVYRRAIDASLEHRFKGATEAERYQLEMTFSRGLYRGWLHGVNHQELVPARFGKKRGPYAGRIERVGLDFVELEPAVPMKAGDGVVFDTGGDTDKEQGGRIYEIRGRRFYFQHRKIDFRKLRPGDRVWKTDDPGLNKTLRDSFSGKLEPRRRALNARVTGAAGLPLVLELSDGLNHARVESKIALQPAAKSPLDGARLREPLGRLGETPFFLDRLEYCIEGEVILPIGEVNRMRREAVEKLTQEKVTLAELEPVDIEATLKRVLPAHQAPPDNQPQLHLLCRTMEQIEVALELGTPWIYVDFEDIRRYRDAVGAVRNAGGASQVALATPRIQKAGEQGFFKLIAGFEPDAVLIRNLGGIRYFKEANVRMFGDFSLNAANPLTAQFLMGEGLERLTISYDLNAEQVLDLIRSAPPCWFELTLHQHMPMFHMEHCVFAAFLSDGTDYTNCGRPCETRDLKLRDRVGMEHPVKADVGCRNTVFNALAQTGAQAYPALLEAGLRIFRIEFLLQPAQECRRVVNLYRELLAGERNGGDLWKDLQAQAQLGVTRGTYG